ncbi:hypothetical protein AMATHDRAFT_5776 [Amanita thiersii Skay4041]|uniref:Uncharacterized protein n=1 Tax=Amanita thiersii Skay4041 TaxID=703135 RepID=A0A2A9NL54_9AGAR|nr:hypothetical protein AMATHDRAFT_5776 [Amanita thiersii Skay4041]
MTSPVPRLSATFQVAKILNSSPLVKSSSPRITLHLGKAPIDVRGSPDWDDGTDNESPDMPSGLIHCPKSKNPGMLPSVHNLPGRVVFGNQGIDAQSLDCVGHPNSSVSGLRILLPTLLSSPTGLGNHVEAPQKSPNVGSKPISSIGYHIRIHTQRGTLYSPPHTSQRKMPLKPVVRPIDMDGDISPILPLPPLHPSVVTTSRSPVSIMDGLSSLPKEGKLRRTESQVSLNQVAGSSGNQSQRISPLSSSTPIVPRFVNRSLFGDAFRLDERCIRSPFIPAKSSRQVDFGEILPHPEQPRTMGLGLYLSSELENGKRPEVKPAPDIPLSAAITCDPILHSQWIYSASRHRIEVTTPSMTPSPADSPKLFGNHFIRQIGCPEDK